MSDVRGDANALRRLRHVGTVLFLAIVALLITHIALLESIVRKQNVAAQISELVAEQTADLIRIGRNAQAILMLREQGVAGPTMIASNRAVIASLSNLAANRDRSIDQLLDSLRGPFFPTTEAEETRQACRKVVTAFLKRSIELGALSTTPVSRAWTLPDLAIAPHGVLITSLGDLDRIARVFAATWRRIELGFSIVSIVVVAALAAVLVFRYFRPLASRALADFLDLQASHSVRTRYFYQMSHELRTPLNVINGYAELLVQSENSRTTRHAGSILAAGQQLAGRVDDILMLAELQSRTYRASPEPLDPAEIAHSIAGPKVPNAPTVTVVDHRRGPGTVNTDRVALRTIMAHLVRNAVSHARTGCEIRLLNEADGMALEVVDDGPGIDPASLARLFQPFHTTTNAILEADSGPGLGLTIVSLLADLNRIDLTVYPNRPSGTTVRLGFAAPGEDRPDPGLRDTTAASSPSGPAACST